MVSVSVTFFYRPERPAAFVSLCGEWSAFRPTPMARRGDGSFEVTIEAAIGVYEYKLHVEGARWELDPENPRTRSRGGLRNNVLVVGGAEEPILHAPVSPFVAVEEDGRLCIRSALRRGHGEGLVVRWDEGAGAREEAMRVAAEEDEHVVFEARLPASARRVAYVFRLESGRLVGRAGGAGQWFLIARPEAPKGAGRGEGAAGISIEGNAGPEASGDAFRAGRVVAPLPVRLYVTVTERCNLRCAHCITDAPEKTRSGSARTMQPWLLDALREPFAAADYVGFVHGGEAIVAPMFPEVLATIQRARAGRPGRTDVHLLSNGMLLDEGRFDALCDLGLTSLSISLDGATAATSDGLRIGGRFATIVKNIEGMLRRRAARGVDVRIGISAVVTASNVDELPALGRLAASLGVDWLKVEEVFPCTPRAQVEWIDPRGERISRAVRALGSILAPAGVVLVDHLDPRGDCPCAAGDDPALRVFRAADDFANRARFLTCRMEWEQACIDPDGTVHPVAYEAPAIGSLASSPLVSLWNGEVMQDLRRAALSRTPAPIRRACPEVACAPAARHATIGP
ncbi:radical SAM protein [Polyangium jinanense]|uniref:Radical SAM protein n=1 Tax=Polyangium jinanense TaxID=2829994 RepID=A0A9X3X0C9_9BACT|nr:radical SAM protein [Polyangium jinanense]MDC3954868.1 radical SAM protein [Polyangium jinanense]MDC3981362.1 radical SAM protein [Polyangium jinanense]